MRLEPLGNAQCDDGLVNKTLYAYHFSSAKKHFVLLALKQHGLFSLHKSAILFWGTVKINMVIKIMTIYMKILI